MRASRLTVLFLVVAACSGDTFQSAAGGAGGGGTAGTDPAGTGGSETAGTTGEGGTTVGEGGATVSGGEGGTGAGEGGGAGLGGAGQAAGSGGGLSAGAAGSTVTPGGAGGGAGKSGGAGAAGNAGTGGCKLMPPAVAPTQPKCGNGVVESGETCDDGTLFDNDGCSAFCQVECKSPGALVDGHCYSLVDSNSKAENIYDGPTQPNQAQDLVRPRWAADPCAPTGVATHMMVLETPAEQVSIQQSAPFTALIVPKIALIGAYIGAGARHRDDLLPNKLEAWRNGEGGMFPGTWKANSPSAAGGRCVVINKAGTFENVLCFLPGGTASAPRSVLCEREQACAITDGAGTAHVGYLGPNKHCYVRFPTPGDLPVSRADAEATCAGSGAHLVAFESLAELSGPAALTGANLTSGGVWVAARKLACLGGKLAWETNGVEVNPGAAFWSDGQPNLNAGACATMGRNRRLEVTACEGLADVLCERDY